MFRPVISALAAFALLAAPAPARDDNWVRVRSANFVVVSDAGEGAARDVALRFEQVRAAFGAALPIATAHPSPVITILAFKGAASFRELLKPLSQKGHALPAGIFSHRLDQFYIALPIGALAEDSYTTIYHEYFHSLTSPYYPNLPAWLAEGLAEFYASTRIDSSEITMGLADPVHIAQLTREPMIPLPVLFQVDHESRYYNEELKASVFYAESWALTHYLMVGGNGTHKQSLLNYLTAINHGESSEQAARETLGDSAALEKQLSQYVRAGAFSNLRAQAAPVAKGNDFRVQVIDDADAAAYQGGFLAVQGQATEGVRILQQAVHRDPESPLAWRNLCAALFFAGSRKEAMQAASRAIELAPNEALSHYIRAYLAFNGSMLPPNPEMEADLRAAVALGASFASPYSMVAAYLAAQNRDLDFALAAARNAVSLEPRNSADQLILAKVLGRMKRYDEARAAATVALADAEDATGRAEADQFLTFLDRAAATRATARFASGLHP